MLQKDRIRNRVNDILLGVIGGGFLGMSVGSLLNKYSSSIPQWVYTLLFIVSIILLIIVVPRKAKEEILKENK